MYALHAFVLHLVCAGILQIGLPESSPLTYLVTLFSPSIAATHYTTSAQTPSFVHLDHSFTLRLVSMSDGFRV